VGQLAREGAWAKAVELYEGLGAAGVGPDTTLANSVISACDKGGQWEKALELFK
jgi:pentatricopeptide repeat domain-containing protein 1